jgi:hypothetical protein
VILRDAARISKLSLSSAIERHYSSLWPQLLE